MVAPSAVVYCATKYVVWAISEGLRQKSKTIRVTTISQRDHLSHNGNGWISACDRCCTSVAGNFYYAFKAS